MGRTAGVLEIHGVGLAPTVRDARPQSRKSTATVLGWFSPSVKVVVGLLQGLLGLCSHGIPMGVVRVSCQDTNDSSLGVEQDGSFPSGRASGMVQRVEEKAALPAVPFKQRKVLLLQELVQGRSPGRLVTGVEAYVTCAGHGRINGPVGSEKCL